MGRHQLPQGSSTYLRADATRPPFQAQQAALWGASVIFGLLHAVTPLYLVWATLAGALLGAFPPRGDYSRSVLVESRPGRSIATGV